MVAAARSHPHYPVDATDEPSVSRFLDSAGPFDAIVAAFGQIHIRALPTMATEQFRIGLDSKVMGQVSVALAAVNRLRDRGSITLTRGILTDPIRHGANPAAVNAAIEGFVAGAGPPARRVRRLATWCSPCKVFVLHRPWTPDRVGLLASAEVAREYPHARPPVVYSVTGDSHTLVHRCVHSIVCRAPPATSNVLSAAADISSGRTSVAKLSVRPVIICVQTTLLSFGSSGGGKRS